MKVIASATLYELKCFRSPLATAFFSAAHFDNVAKTEPNDSNTAESAFFKPNQLFHLYLRFFKYFLNLLECQCSFT
ncbi:hypothetical protein DPMN_079729 [Dreissena polymorpha]|uniref:Uncharacterized protein n=1 Tax=Dreissena polymorpha TaxID=45954 RepID=A0A9D4BIL5_DREPO|nr:hypothetical protein DPMN_079729 [Dreissena polymorpha]